MAKPRKPHLLKIIPPVDASFILKGDPIPWDNPWHYHPELELICCIKGKGTNFVGNDIRSIEEGEILLLGSNLPHTRQRDRKFYEQNPEETPESIIIQFNEDFLGKDFFDTLEFQHVRELKSRASRGIKFTGNVAQMVIEKLFTMLRADKTQRMISLLMVLDILARAEHYEFLNGTGYVSDAHLKNAQKINLVYEYTITNFRKPIELPEIAALTSLSVSAFCRYFKTRTRKSYFQYLTEVRIGYACRLLSEGRFDIGQVAYESGFNNLSNFNKQFRKIMQSSPSEYYRRTVGK
ncbi:AraC family transcriptional regulator [Dyadobacter luticola]|uniref:Helix-turn-helix domain-containing protein n=1 Tax=Dyadobacter luticola TaxID=1979387 RepID=A0A5R9L4E9_9BACT|nr:AraC family transcriptional regulator [Dyadobacter luticola]TLV03219.1 helix-turn-helix domain-containing protein [Dyadobacter luticola]